MTPTLTAEQIGELEMLLAKDGEPASHVFNCMNFAAALRNAAPALIATAKQVIDHDSPAWDANERLNDTVEELIERAEKAEAEVATLLARLKSTESALDRAMARSNSWREEAAKIQAQMLAKEVGAVSGGGAPGGSAGGKTGGSAGLGREYSTLPEFMQPAPAETSRTCATCAHLLKNMGAEPCFWCGAQLTGFSRWTPKPIPSTTDKGENP